MGATENDRGPAGSDADEPPEDDPDPDGEDGDEPPHAAASRQMPASHARIRATAF